MGCASGSIARPQAEPGHRWRLGSELNRRTRICSPLHDHSATQPLELSHQSTGATKNPGCTGVSRVVGAGNEVRTRDLNLGKVALYQLSYSRDEARILTAGLRVSTQMREMFSAGHPLHRERRVTAPSGSVLGAGSIGRSKEKSAREGAPFLSRIDRSSAAATRDGSGPVAQWNCSSSVEPVSAFTLLDPPWITVVTSSK